MPFASMYISSSVKQGKKNIDAINDLTRKFDLKLTTLSSLCVNQSHAFNRFIYGIDLTVAWFDKSHEVTINLMLDILLHKISPDFGHSVDRQTQFHQLFNLCAAMPPHMAQMNFPHQFWGSSIIRNDVFDISIETINW